MRLFAVFFLAAALLPAIPAAADPPELAVGEPFPPIEFPVLGAEDEGARSSIADFRGRRLVLHVFASW